MGRIPINVPLTPTLKHSIGATLLLLAFILYIYGVSAPVVRITGGGPVLFDGKAGDHDFSLPKLLRLLLDQGNYAPFVCIFMFSFVFPLLKFALLTATLISSACCFRWAYSVSSPLRMTMVLRVLAKYQFVDVFSTIILVSFINFVGVSAEPLVAAGAYQTYCLLSIITTQWMCHCYSERLERYRLRECRGQVHLALCSPLLPRCIPVNGRTREDIIFNGCAAPVDLSECSTTFSARRLTRVTSPASAEDPRSNIFLWCSQNIRHRASSQSHSASPDGSYPRPVNLAECSGYTSLAVTQPANSGDNNPCLRAAWERNACRAVTAADLPASSLPFPRGPCLRDECFFAELPHAPAHIPEGIAPEEPVHLPIAALRGSTYPKRCFSECLLRMFFLACSFCISAFSALTCWLRPILQVALVPGKQRGFAIETSVMSLGDVFWRLYSVGPLWSGCAIIVVFPLLATFILYVASIGAVASACFVYWAARSSYQLPECPVPGIVSQGSPHNAVYFPQKAMYLTKTFSNISAFLGDIAMPDVQSIGLLTCYFIANNIDFLGARLPGTPLSQPSGTVESLLWNMSGFWAMVALGLSASQVHRLAISFEDVCQDMHALFRNSSASNSSYLASPLFSADLRLPRSPLCDSKGTVLGDGMELIPNDSAVASTPELTAPMENSNILNCNSRSRRSRSPSLGLILHGCVRMAASVALLLPIWLKPTDILEVDIGLVNKHLQGFTDYVNPLLKEILPKTVGDCASAAHVAPQPCFGSMPLAFIRTKVYEATARWATGLNTTELLAVRFGAIPENRIMLTVTGKIKSLALSLRIGGCLYGEDPGRCPTIWDGTDGCCGDDIKFRLQMSVMCNSSFPYLADAILAPTHISKLVVKENILGIFPVEVADITQIVEDQLSEWARAFLDPHNKWIHWKDGETLSVISLLNVLLDINAPGGVRCPRV